MVDIVVKSGDCDQDTAISSTSLECILEASRIRLTEDEGEITALTATVEALEQEKESEGAVEAGQDGNDSKVDQPHSVEYWTVGAKGKPMNLLKRYFHANRNIRQSEQNNRNWYPRASQSKDIGVTGNPTAANGRFVESFGPNGQPFHQVMARSAQQINAGPPPISMQSAPYFVPPTNEHTWNHQAFQFPWYSNPPFGHLQPPAPFVPVSPHLTTTPYTPPYYGPSFQQPRYPFTHITLPTQMSYFQAAPLFYQVPPIPQYKYTPLNPLAQPFYCNQIAPESHNYPPPTYEDAIQTAMPATTDESCHVEIGAISSLTASPSSSDTDVSSINELRSAEIFSASSEYTSSLTSSPLLTSVSSSSGSRGEKTMDSPIVSDVGKRDKDLSGSFHGMPTYGPQSFNSQLTPMRNAAIDIGHCQQNHLIYPGNMAILVYTLSSGNRIVVLYTEEEVPYVSNVFDFRVEATFKEQIRPALHYPYYVPPHTPDNDFFGGQMPIWQVKMGQYFMKYQPHNWKMHGVPEDFNLESVFGGIMDVFGEFHIVSKLRFSCSTCKTPWTSKKGTIVFKFCYNSSTSQGWILMQIYGQTCRRIECRDWNFQNPACYPEEIDRAMKKLSEYIGNQCYGIAVPPRCFDDCFKSIRRSAMDGNHAKVGNKNREKSSAPPQSHRREYCQACHNGVCKNIYAKPYSTFGSEISNQLSPTA